MEFKGDSGVSFGQVLFNEGEFQWERLENLMVLAADPLPGSKGLDLSDSVVDGAKVYAQSFFPHLLR